MSIILSKGIGKGKSWKSSFGGLRGKLSQDMLNMTFKEFIDKIAKQSKIENGEVELLSIDFNVRINTNLCNKA